MKTIKYILVLLLLIFIPILILFLCHKEVVHLSQWLDAQGSYAAIDYIFIFILLCSLGGPPTLFEVMGGILFPFNKAVLYAYSAKLISSVLAYVLARSCLRRHLFQLLAKSPDALSYAKLITHGVSSYPWRVSFMIRMCTIPMVVKNYGLALFKCPFRIFLTATAICGLPFTVVWVQIGCTSRSILDDVASQPEWRVALHHLSHNPLRLILFIIGIVLVVVVMASMKVWTDRMMKLMADGELDDDLSINPSTHLVISSYHYEPRRYVYETCPQHLQEGPRFDAHSKLAYL